MVRRSAASARRMRLNCSAKDRVPHLRALQVDQMRASAIYASQKFIKLIHKAQCDGVFLGKTKEIQLQDHANQGQRDLDDFMSAEQ